MYRGIFSYLSSNDMYNSSEKEWIVELDRYHRYWYDLIVNPSEVAEYFDTRQLIVDYLKKIKKEVEAHLEKRFIYFICSRERVRFNINKKPSYNPFTKKVKIYILVGEHKKKSSVKCVFVDSHTKRPCMPEIKITDKYITMKDSMGRLETYSVHDFLEGADIRLGLDSRVEYVGCTKNPHTRPTNGSHTGLSDVLHQIAEEKRDSFIYFNIFKVMSYAINTKTNLTFTIANSMVNEIDVELEGKILEKCFIFYFDSKNQARNKVKEHKELETNLINISNKNKINAIHVNYEFSKKNEYAIFSSSRVPADIRHVFTVRNDAGGVTIENGSRLFDGLV